MICKVVNYKDSRCSKFEGKFDIKTLESYPLELLENRELIEMSYVFSLWKNPENFDDFADINPATDILSNDGKFYYDLGLNIYNMGVKSIDDASIHTFIKDDKELTEEFARKGGYKVFHSLKKILNSENMEAYYNNLIKHNVLLNLYSKGFAIVENLAKFNSWTTSQIYTYFEYQLDNTFLNRGSGVKIEDFTITDEFLEKCHNGEAKGLSYAEFAPLLNYHTLGVHTSNVTVFAGYSSTGKSSFAVHTYLMSILEAGESLSIVANEMNLEAWQHIVLATVLSQKFNYFDLPRQTQKTGNWNSNQWEMVRKAQEYINTEWKGRLKFVKIFDYAVEDVKRVFKKLAKLGFKYGIYDTFKAENAASGNLAGELVEASKQLLQVAEKEDIGIIITMQLAIHTENQRFLTGNTLSNSKAVKEVASEMILMRELWEDEYTGKTFDVKPYKRMKDKVTGKLQKAVTYFETDPTKKYRIIFLDKTRNGDNGITLLFQFDGAWNKWTEIGYCTVSHKNRV